MDYSLAGIVRASSVFPILSTCLLMLGGLCVGVGRVYNKTNNVLLSAGILFVAAGEQSRKSRALVMRTGPSMWLRWSHIVFHQWRNHKTGQDLYSPHSSSDEDTLRVLMRDL